MNEKKINVVGIGNAIVDVIANVEDEFLKTCKLEKGSMRLVCEEEANTLHSQISVIKVISGGSVANSIAGLAILGNRVAFIGKVNNDELGNAFGKELKKLGVIFNTPKAEDVELSTARCIVLTTPDSQRTMNTCLGIAGNLYPEDIDDNLITESKIAFIEGYLWDQQPAKKAVSRVIDLAAGSGSSIAMSLSDKMCVERHRKEFNDTVSRSVDILFSNENEIMALFEVGNMESAIKMASELDIIAAITRSGHGSVIVKGKEIINVPAEKTAVLDSTGAGDMYAAGFLHAFISGRDLYTCGRSGSIVAAEVISHFGARPENPLLELLARKGL
jgi:sugar/nucleoside kinase (ribokinase family)